MNSSLFSQAIDEAFPNLDEETRAEIKDKVTSHMFVKMKEKVFANKQEDLHKFNLLVKEEIDPTERSQIYVSKILEKFASLPEEDRQRIDQELNGELLNIMHKIYQAYE